MFDAIFGSFVVFNVSTHFFNLFSESLDFLGVWRLALNKFKMFVVFFFQLLFDVSDISMKKFFESFLCFCQLIVDVDVEIVSGVIFFMLTFDFFLSRIDNFSLVIGLGRLDKFFKIFKVFGVNLCFFVFDVFFPEVELFH